MIDKFRLQRDGSIRNVVVQQSSGNPYYNMAGQGAVERRDSCHTHRLVVTNRCHYTLEACVALGRLLVLVERRLDLDSLPREGS